MAQVSKNNNNTANSAMEKSKKEDKYACCICCIGSLFLIGIIVSYGVYFSYAIYALSKVSDKTVRDTCEGSILWRYVLVSIIVPFALSGSAKNKDDSDSKANMFASMFCWFAASLIMSCFGGIEFIENDCEEEFTNKNKTELLYNIGKIGFGLYLSIGILLFIIMTTMSAFICCTVTKINSNKFSSASNPETTPTTMESSTYVKKTNDVNV